MTHIVHIQADILLSTRGTRDTPWQGTHGKHSNTDRYIVESQRYKRYTLTRDPWQKYPYRQINCWAQRYKRYILKRDPWQTYTYGQICSSKPEVKEIHLDMGAMTNIHTQTDILLKARSTRDTQWPGAHGKHTPTAIYIVESKRYEIHLYKGPMTNILIII